MSFDLQRQQQAQYNSMMIYRMTHGHHATVKLNDDNNDSMDNTASYNTTTYKYMTTKLIGSGTFGEIWSVIEKYDVNNCPKQRLYAIKMIKNRKKKYEQVFVNEGKRVMHLNNISTSEVGKYFIIKCKQLLYCTSNNNPILNLFNESPLMGPCIVMELCGYSLLQYMKFHEAINSQISLATIRHISTQLLFAMSFLHGIGGCIHSDLKPENIVIKYTDCYKNGETNHKILSKTPNIKIIDFGNAIDINRHKKLKSFNLQSLWYRSPEVLLGNHEEISPLIDIWSIGCILFELASLHLPVKQVKRVRLFTSEKLSPAHVVYKISAKVSAFPPYVYNPHKSFHYVDYVHSVHSPSRRAQSSGSNGFESSYLKSKNERKLRLLKNLQFNGFARNNINNNKIPKQEEFMFLVDLLSCLLDLNPLTRYTSEDAIRHKFTVYNYTNVCMQDKVHPIIKSCSDTLRQSKTNLQISKYLKYLHCKVSVASKSRSSEAKSLSFPLTVAKQHL